MSANVQNDFALVFEMINTDIYFVIMSRNKRIVSTENINDGYVNIKSK